MDKYLFPAHSQLRILLVSEVIRLSVILHNFGNKNRILECYGNISPLKKGE
jgi:hypothetical protein